MSNSMKFQKLLLLVLAGVCLGMAGFGQVTLTPEELVNNSIDYHDPKHKWWKFDKQLSLGEYPSEELKNERGKYDTHFGVNLFRSENSFSMSFSTKGKTQTISKTKDGCRIEDDYELVDKIETGIGVLSCEQLGFWRDYLDFLYSMPMNLEGVTFTELSKVEEVKFNKKDCYAFSGRFPGEGKHLYTFYFDASTYAMTGFRFSKDGTLNNGEYLYFEGETTAGKIRLPTNRSWYYNKDDGFLATDVLFKWSKL